MTPQGKIFPLPGQRIRTAPRPASSPPAPATPSPELQIISALRDIQDGIEDLTGAIQDPGIVWERSHTVYRPGNAAAGVAELQFPTTTGKLTFELEAWQGHTNLYTLAAAATTSDPIAIILAGKQDNPTPGVSPTGGPFVLGSALMVVPSSGIGRRVVSSNDLQWLTVWFPTADTTNLPAAVTIRLRALRGKRHEPHRVRP